MSDPAANFVNELPTGDLQLGSEGHVRVYGFADLKPPLVELRIALGQGEDVINLFPDQADAIAAALIAAAKKARSGCALRALR